jgi:hypothetical protein
METTDQEIEKYRKRLNDLTAKCSDKYPETHLQEELKKLASEVGASTYVLWVSSIDSRAKSTSADTSELIRNIHQALQTASMSNMCRSAREGYEIATEASKRAVEGSRSASVQFWIAAAIAFLSAIAAWIAAWKT